jgi:hypothetical protein
VATAFLTFFGTREHDPAIDCWIDSRPSELAAIARPWFARMRACGADVRELMHDSCPTACVGEAAFAYVNVFAAHVNVGFFHGAALPDPAGLLEGQGRHMRLQAAAGPRDRSCRAGAADRGGLRRHRHAPGRAEPVMRGFTTSTSAQD